MHLELTVAIAAEQLLRKQDGTSISVSPPAKGVSFLAGEEVEQGRLSIHNLISGYPLSSIWLPRAFSPILTHRLSCSPFDISAILLYLEWEKVDYVKFI